MVEKVESVFRQRNVAGGVARLFQHLAQSPFQRLTFCGAGVPIRVVVDGWLAFLVPINAPYGRGDDNDHNADIPDDVRVGVGHSFGRVVLTGSPDGRLSENVVDKKDFKPDSPATSAEQITARTLPVSVFERTAPPDRPDRNGMRKLIHPSILMTSGDFILSVRLFVFALPL